MTKSFYYTCIVFLITSTAIAQTTPSMMWDAVSLLNARKGVNALLVPKTSGYDVVDPVTGEIVTAGMEDTVSAALTTDDATSKQIIMTILRRHAVLAEKADEAAIQAA